MFFLRPFKISSFSSRHSRHFLCPVLHDGICLTISQLIVYFRLLSFSCQMYLESSVSLRYFFFLIDFLWFRYLFLKSLAVTPMYVFVSLLPVVVTLALYSAFVCKQFPRIGHWSECLQSQCRELFVLVVFACLSCLFRIVLLCLVMKDRMFSLQL